MANFDAPDLSYKNQHSHAYGNKAVAMGAPVLAAIPQIGDVIRLSRIPRGSKLTGDAWFNHSIVGPASSTGDFGYVFVDGSVGDPNYFSLTPVDLTAVGKHDSDAGLKPVVLTKDAYLIVTIAGANFVAATDFWGNADYESVGLA